jgi:hypothetical protein
MMENQTNPKLELLKRFCQKIRGHRAHLSHPMRHDGYLYASTGWIAIRVEDDPSIEALDDKEMNTIYSVFKRGEIEFHPLPTLPDAVKCKHCNGTGIQYLEECPECDGEGEFIHGRHSYECKECDCSGEIVSDSASTEPTGCWHCSGSGEADYQSGVAPTKVGGVYFQNQLLRMIANLPNSRIEHAPESDAKSLRAVHFIFDGGEGAVMPFRMES